MIGVTSSDVSKISAGTLAVPEKFRATQAAIDTTYAKYGEDQYNIVGNATNSWDLGEHEQYVNFKLQIQKIIQLILLVIQR